jgi:hypothetical protein
MASLTVSQAWKIKPRIENSCMCTVVPYSKANAGLAVNFSAARMRWKYSDISTRLS